ncbi:hypothetical protein J437_LFUL004966 [Ladona fulva]|uniref:Heat shock factor 2-binding protein n=1 Tax=Ladona fulva TaxID=123851 RepID=A0A8K0K059_LADFU|nr:hypothetical protein J437_LFUL004966 [Ladona fulva]
MEMSLEEVELFETLSRNVKDISKIVTEILHDIPGTFPGEIQTKLTELSEESQLLKDNINSIIFGDQRSELKISQKSLSKVLKDAKQYSSDYHASKLDSLSLRKQITRQEEITASLQQQLIEESNENSYLREQLQNERSTCTSMGATVACMLWRACRESDVVNSILKWQYKFPEFLRMVTGTLESFISTYVVDDSEPMIPSAGSEEGHFVAGMLGTVTNMLASSAGRECLLLGEGQELLLSMIECLSQIPAKQGEYLRRLILMAFHNVIIDESGLQFLWKQDNFPQALTKNLLHINDECRFLSLRILAIFTSSHTPFETVHVLKNTNTDDLIKIAENNGEDSILAKEILRSLQI